MSDYYHNFLSSVSGLGTNSSLSSQDASPVPTTAFSSGGNMETNTFQNMAYYPGCRKGTRDCVYPDTPASKYSSSHGVKDADSSRQASPTSSNEEDDDDVDQDTKLSPIPDEDEEDLASVSEQSMRSTKSLRHMSTASSLNLKRLLTRTRQPSETPSQEGNKGSSPTRSIGTASSLTPMMTHSPDLLFNTVPDLSQLPADLRFYLEYFLENITHYHYGVHRDFGSVFRTTLVSLALRSEPLLYAMISFAAYHQTLRDPNGQLPQFLKYYNKSVILLLDLLKNEDRHELATLLTILQLATIEEYLGDWVNLMGHQKAALEILSQLFTPQSIVETSLNRTILSWYIRFDILVGLMGGFVTSLPRDWFVTFDEFCRAKLASEPDNLDWLYERAENRLRLICHDICLLVVRRARDNLTGASATVEHENVARQLREWRETLEPALTDPTRLIVSSAYSSDESLSARPALLYDSPLTSTTLLLCEWHAMVMMHLYQASQDSQGQISTGLGSLSQHAEAISQIFNAGEQWASGPKGLLIMLHPCLTIASMFLPPSPGSNVWLRKKFALLESSGYIFPITVRTRMAELFQDETVVRWWLPDDHGFTPMLQSVRAFADERNAAATSAQSESLQDMKNVFAALHLGGDATPVAGTGSGMLGSGRVGKDKGIKTHMS
ncbi:hypothetical protein J7T55_010098 [Diaporthe amygdali]|uniref:uncharacterized protein n=1 Tax=Phomopsis amygdali TaxID=1214568 RepID=UPI0022FF3259|nr:uncharacterized protein J7T55_010098 [Diaporthe amygdali]KAJ0113854.1 hypothetical protein J7T55_010098 [Diaporthe amygdali]